MFSWRNKKNINTFGLKKSALTSAMEFYTVYLSFSRFLDITNGRSNFRRSMVGSSNILGKHSFHLRVLKTPACSLIH